jgi:hypothetical protein
VAGEAPDVVADARDRVRVPAAAVHRPHAAVAVEQREAGDRLEDHADRLVRRRADDIELPDDAVQVLRLAVEPEPQQAVGAEDLVEPIPAALVAQARAGHRGALALEVHHAAAGAALDGVEAELLDRVEAPADHDRVGPEAVRDALIELPDVIEHRSLALDVDAREAPHPFRPRRGVAAEAAGRALLDDVRRRAEAGPLQVGGEPPHPEHRGHVGGGDPRLVLEEAGRALREQDGGHGDEEARGHRHDQLDQREAAAVAARGADQRGGGGGMRHRQLGLVFWSTLVTR